MKISENRKAAMYSAIHEQLMQLRLKLKQEYDLPEYVDYQIAQLATPIYRDVKAALNITEASSD